MEGNEVIIERMEGMKNLINEKLDDLSKEMKLTKEQCIQTNGRVKKLELWKAMLIGAWGVISIVLISIIIPLAQNYLKGDKSVKTEVQSVMSQYFNKKDLTLKEEYEIKKESSGNDYGVNLK